MTPNFPFSKKTKKAQLAPDTGVVKVHPKASEQVLLEKATEKSHGFVRPQNLEKQWLAAWGDGDIRHLQSNAGGHNFASQKKPMGVGISRLNLPSW